VGVKINEKQYHAQAVMPPVIQPVRGQNPMIFLKLSPGISIIRQSGILVKNVIASAS